MARRGTKVGDAYIEIHGDNSDWVEAVKRQRKAWLDGEGKAANRFEKIWQESIDNTIDKQMSRLVTSGAHRDFSAWVRQWGDLDEAGERFNRTLEDFYKAHRKNNAITEEQADNLRKMWSEWEAQERARLVAHEEEVQRNRLIAIYEKDQAKRAREFREEQVRLNALARRNAEWENRQFDKRRRHQEKIQAMAERTELANRKLRALREDITREYREVHDLTELTADDHERINTLVEEQNAGVRNASRYFARLRKERSAYNRLLEAWARREGIASDDATDRELDNIRKRVQAVVRGTETVQQAVTRLDRRIDTDRRGGIFSRMFGNQDRDFSFFGRFRGSRNNFLNLVGGMFQPIERMGSRLGNTIGNLVSRGLRPMINALSRGGRVASVASRGLAALGPVLSSGAAAAIALGVALAAFNLILGPVVSLFSGLLGIVTALASSLMSGLVGSLVMLLPILGAAGAGVAALVVGIQGMTDAQKEALAPLEEWYESLSRQVSRNLFGNLESQVDSFIDSLGGHFETSLSRSASAISDTIDEILSRIEGPDFQKVLDTLDRTLPNILGNVSSMFGSLGLGITGVMAAISPQVEKLTDEWAESLSDWADWAVSPEGQEELSDWFDEVIASAKELWDLLGSVGNLIGSIMGDDKARETGDSWIDTLSDKINELADWISSPEGQKAMTEWISWAEDLGEDILDIVESVKEFTDTLNDDDSKSNLESILNVIELIADGLDAASKAWKFISNIEFGSLSISDVLGGLGDAAKWITEGGFGDTWDSIKGWFSDLGTKIGKWWSKIDWSEIMTSIYKTGADIVEGLINGIVDSLFPEPVQEAFGNIIDWVKEKFGISSPSTVFFQIGVDIVQGLINGLLSMLGPLGTASQSLINTIDRIWSDGEGGVPGVVGRATGEFAKLIPGLDRITGQAGNVAKSGMQSIGSKMTGEARKIPGQVSGAMSPLTPRIGSQVSRAVSRAVGVFGGLASRLAREVRQAVNAAVSAMSGLGGRLAGQASAAVSAVRGVGGYSAGYSVGYSIAKGMINGMGALRSSVYATAYSMAASAEKAARSALISRSPSRAMMRVGEDAVSGFIIPFADSLGQVRSASTNMVEAMFSGINPDSMYARGRAAASGLVDGLGSAGGYDVDVSTMSASGAASASRSGTVVMPGAIQVVSNARSPENSGIQILDGIAEGLVGA